jgi:Acyclic terpene utilisation family protein AtuA
VRISGVRGSPPPPTLKVALNDAGGFRNTMTLVLTGLDIEAKAAHAEALLFEVLGGKDRFAEVDVRLLRFDTPDAPANERATAHLRITVKDPDQRKVGRAFSNATMELALGGYAGFHTTTPPTAESAYGIYRPAAVPRTAVRHTAVLAGGERRVIPDPEVGAVAPASQPPAAPVPDGPRTRVPLGTICGARSGDKGGDANIGLWTRTDAEYTWLRGFMTADKARELLGPEVSDLAVDVWPLPNLRALNVVVHGILGSGVAASTRPDPQAKGLGEYLRSRVVDVPRELLG